MRDFLLWFALGYFVVVLVGKRAERKKRGNLAVLKARALIDYANARTIDERAAAHRRIFAEPMNALGLVAPAWPENDPTWTPAPSPLRHRKAPNSGIILCRHRKPIFTCDDASCLRMVDRYLLSRRDDALRMVDRYLLSRRDDA